MHVGGDVCISPLFTYCLCISLPSQRLLTHKLFVVVKVKAEETKYMLLSHDMNVGQNHDRKTANK
jgi:hypothetical protein